MWIESKRVKRDFVYGGGIMAESEIQFEKLGNSYRLNTWLQFSSAERENFLLSFTVVCLVELRSSKRHLSGDPS